MAESRKRKILTLEQRVDVIQKNERGMSCRAIAAELHVGKTQIQSIVREKESIMKMWKDGSVSTDAKFFKARKTTYSEIDSHMWVTSINNKMKIQKRKILLLIDNCPAHPPVTASNVKLVFLPPNTTSRLQPCDAGIIRAFKAHYRKRLLRHVLCPHG